MVSFKKAPDTRPDNPITGMYIQSDMISHKQLKTGSFGHTLP